MLFVSTPLLASEVDCVGKVYSFTVENKEDHKVGSLIIQNQVLQRLAMTKNSVDTPEYVNLVALYKGKTTEDSFNLYIFKKKDKSAHISFLETESILGHKKVTELRCKLKKTSSISIKGN